MRKIDLTKYSPEQTIKIIREWSELTQKEFGKTVGVNEERISNYERGKSRYTFEFLLKVAKKHDIKIIAEKDK